MAYDLLIKNGKVVDGTGCPWFYADLAIENGRIVEIGEIDAPAKKTIDVDGLYVAPGFIDIHSHADMQLSSPRHPEFLDCFINQGITTVVSGNCGFSPAPLPVDYFDDFKNYVAFLAAPDARWEWHSFEDWMDYLDRQGVIFNVAPLAGHLPIRIEIMGFERRKATPAELAKMQQSVDKAMRAGAFGFSVGLVYSPSFCADMEELAALAVPVSCMNGLYAGHFRGYSETLIDSLKEAAEIGKRTKARIQFSHLHAMGKAYWEMIPETLDLFDQYRAEGVDIAYDAIPIYIGTTGLSRLFPFKYLEGGVENLLAKLKDPVTREIIRKEVEDTPAGKDVPPEEWWENFVELLGYDNLKLMIPAVDEDRPLVGIPFSELAKRQGITPFDFMVELTLREKGDGCVELVGVSGDQPDSEGLLQCLANKNGVISTDAVNTGNGPGNPTSYCAFPRVLGYYARDKALFPLEEAVRKITAFPAQRTGIKGRGLLQEGFFADVTIFDYERVRDHQTSATPTASPEGIEYVIINGKIVKEGSQVEREALAGKVLRRGR